MNGNTGINVQLRKGDAHKLKGKLVAYVFIDTESLDSANPLSGMVKNGILAVQANYVDQRNIRDFFREEFGISLEKGIEEVIDQAKETGGLEGALDPEAVKERLESMKNADFIPIPAKIAYFTTEEEMLEVDADVYFLGSFTVVSHAHLCVNSFPIMYQAYFREQEHRALEQEITSLLGNIEGGSEPDREEESGETGIHIKNYQGDVKSYLLKELIPKMIYNREDKEQYDRAKSQFKSFMGNFGFPEDMQEILDLVDSNLAHNTQKLHKLELLVAKIEALQQEDYEKLEKIKKELEEM